MTEGNTDSNFIVDDNSKQPHCVSRQLDRVYEEFDKFCYTVSHDIRAPLYVIEQLTELLIQENETGNSIESSRICRMLQQKARQAAGMSEELYQYSRIFCADLRWEMVDMDAFFREVYEELVLQEKNRVIKYEQMKLPAVWGDANLLRLVIQNILSNAIKFTREKETAYISVEARGEDNMTAYLVTDNGIGFDEKYSEEIFQVFHKLNAEYEGNGIGLASTRRIISQHRGEVEIYSEADKGTTVKLLLPTAQIENERKKGGR